VSVDPGATVPLHRQVYADLRNAIVRGRLAPGTQIPATRLLASELGLSRTTIASAMDQLRAEGYVVGRERAGTFVAAEIPDRTLVVAAKRRLPLGTPAAAAVQPSPRGKRYETLTMPRAPWDDPRPFRPGTPAADAFPTALWLKLTARAWRRPPRDLGRVLTYGDPRGYAPLRRAIASYIGAARATSCTPEQVIVVSGSQQGLALAALVLIDRGDAVWMEDPGYLGARRAFQAADAELVPVPVDDDGFQVDEAKRRAPEARLAYVTPSHQYPLGVTLSAARRLQLLAWARERAAWIVEDDYDSEFRYAGRPLACLQGLEPDARVIYVGTFSKTLFPALRLGYLIVPDALVDAFTAARAAIDRHSPSIEQAVLADFIAEGHLTRHVRRMRALYAERRDLLVDTITRGPLAEWIRIRPSEAGMHLVGDLRRSRPRDAELARTALDAGIELAPLSRFTIEPTARGAVVLGYAAFSAPLIRRAADHLARVLTAR
jgi:GntR family transcriptional regulator / MocR family aminotransferase